MLAILFILSCCLFSVLATSSAPGAAAIWSHSYLASQKLQNGDGGNIQHKTQSFTLSHLFEIINYESSKAELLVLISSGSSNKRTLKQSSIIDSIKAAPEAQIMANIYQPEQQQHIVVGSSTTDLHQALSTSSTSFNTIRTSSLSDFHADLFNPSSSSSSASIFSNSVVDAFAVTLSGNDATDKQYLQEIAHLTSQKRSSVVFVVIDVPSADAFVPNTRGDYYHILGATVNGTTTTTNGNTTINYDPSNSTTGIYYKPEGAEYSIYYADTYLYMTPDIFTGLVTSIFVAFVVYVGLYCLNAVQGASTFVMKPIPLGKEY